MKPILLELSNLGPYVGAPVRIEFDQLERLFLIAGDTGSGKTTLFDAMCYALYGLPLGTRDEKSLRSHLADEGGSTSVTFVFEAGGQRWKVERSPHSVRPKQRGGGVLVEAYTKLFRSVRDAKAPSSSLTWHPVNLKPGKINEKIEQEILHVSHEEFSKILVLPQGEFQRFLEMQTAERAGILEKLFPTKLHDRIAELAKVKASAVVADISKVALLQTEVRRTFDPDTFTTAESAGVQELISLREARATAGERAKAATAGKQESTALAKAFADLATGQEAVVLLEADTLRIDALKGALGLSRKAQRVLPILNQRDTTRRDLDDKRRAAKESAEKARQVEAEWLRLKPLEEALPQRDAALRDMVAEQARAKERQGDIESLTKLERLAVKDGGELAKERQGLVALTAAERAAGESVKALAAHTLARDKVLIAISAAQEEGKRLAQHAREAQNWKAWAKERPAARRELTKKRKESDELVDLEKAAEADVVAARRRLDAEAALRLAGNLAKGKKCPVCGSVEHPRPAKGKNSDEDLRARLESAESALDARRGERQKATELVTTCEGHFKLRDEHAADTLQRLADSGFTSVAEWERATADNAAELQARRGREGELGQLLAQRPRLEAAERKARAAREAKQKAIGEAEIAVAKVRAQRGALVEKTGIVDEFDAALAKALASLTQRAQAIVAERAAIEKLRQEAADFARVLHTERAHEAELKTSLEALQRQTEVLARELREALDLASFATDEDARAAARSVDEQSALESEIGAWTSQLQTARGHIQHLKGITDERERPDLDALEQVERDATAALNEAMASYVRAEHELKELRDRAKRWRELLTEAEKLRTSGQAYIELSRDLNGENRGKLAFSTFIHTWWLEQVLDRGNSRFTRLSEGRYSFRANSEQMDGRRKSGLEIDVWDAHAASFRSVRTLSGGEKFMASLSLALGLSDVILERAGGIELDTLFIDEGFGSLDADALDRALAILDEIGASRTVGVISHVEALKKSVSCQIRVAKGAGGSSVSVVRGQDAVKL